MTPCTTCGSFVRAADPACPACGTHAPRRAGRSAMALLLGLSVACVGETKTDSTSAETGTHSTTPEPDYGVTYVPHSSTPEPEYGVTYTESGHTGTPSESGDTGGSGTAATTGVDYGVPTTTN